MVLVFWLSVAVVAYVYAGYPLLLYAWARLRSRPVAGHIDAPAKPRPPSPNPPSISIIIAARNEGARLGARIENLRALDYPADRRQIIVVSDGSTDDTLDVLAPFGADVDAVAVPAGGKALALNAGVARARGEIVVFADARQTFASDALRQLVAPFADPAVGGVTGELVLDAEAALFANRREASDRRGRTARRVTRERRTGEDRRRTIMSTIGDGVGMYWRYEKQLRRLESAIASTLGATGAIYAVRRSVWHPLPPDTLLDDVLTPMRVVLAGFRVVFNESARAFDRAAADADAEARRKVRTLAGNYQILALEPRLLLPWRNPVWLQYVSHKLGRLVVPYALLAAFAASLALVHRHAVYAGAVAAQVAFYLLAGYGAVLEWTARRDASAPVAPPASAAAVPESAVRAAREVA